MRSARFRSGEALLVTILLGGMASGPASSDPRTSAPPLMAQAAGEPDPDERPAGPRPTLRATVLSPEAERGIKVDGRLGEREWATQDSISNLITIEPEEGGVPNGRTVVRVLAGQDAIVIGVRCFDDPAGIVSFSKARDTELDEEDHVTIVLDTFGDGRSGYVFSVNPSGSRFEGLINAQGDDSNSDWNAVWEASAGRDAEGWSAEIRLPIKSLSFKPGLDAWGFNVERLVQRLQETSRWSGAKRDFEIYQMRQAGLVTGLPEFQLGLGLALRPAVVSGSTRAEAGDSKEYDTQVSLDANQRLGPNLNATLTINTDFAETEADVRQTNLTRFDILFPEKRTFFLEGADIFEFGLGTDLESASVLPFFSRRIGLFTIEGEDEGSQVPILAGGKVQGRVGGTNIGALVVATDRTEAAAPDTTALVPPAEMAAIRIRQNVLSESSVGMIATFGDPTDRQRWTAGGDLTYRTSDFGDEKNLAAGIWGVTTGGKDTEGDRTAYGGKLAYPNDILDLGFTYARIGEEFQPSLGFIHRTGQVYDATGEYNIRPQSELFRRFALGATYFRALNVDGEWESYLGNVRPLDVLFESGDRITAFADWEGEQPFEEFDVFDSPEKTVKIEPGAYNWTRYGLTGILAPKRILSGEVTWSTGDFYDGQLNSIEAVVSLKPHSVLTIAANVDWNDGRFPVRPDPDEPNTFTQFLFGGRMEFNFTPNFQIITFAQYDNESRSLGSSPRLRWTYHPLGDLFVSFNHNMARTFGQDPERWLFESDQLLIKIQHAFRW